MLSWQFINFQGMLYKRMPIGVHLRCMDKNEAHKLIVAVHEGVYGVHMNGTVLAKKIARQGYFWLTMEADCVKFVKKCHNYQVYSDVSHLPSMELQSGVATSLAVRSLGYWHHRRSKTKSIKRSSLYHCGHWLFLQMGVSWVIHYCQLETDGKVYWKEHNL